MFASSQTRRAFLGRAAQGVGGVALASLLQGHALAGSETHYAGAIDPLHFAPKAKRVIWLTMAGGPSHLETFDYKPELARRNGQPMPDSVTRGQPIAQLQGQALRCLGPQHAFRKCGRSGQEISEVFSHLATVADELCIIR